MREHGYVLLGVGSAHDDDNGAMALEWAAREAQSRGTELRLLRADGWPPHLAPWDAFVDGGYRPRQEAAAQKLIRAAETKLAAEFPELEVVSQLVAADPASALLDQARDAAMVVLGSRRLGTIGSTVLGSVSSVVTARSEVPVVVVGSPPGLAGEEPPVVVGVDGTPESDHALGFAFDYASRHRRAVQAVFVWRPDPLAEAEWRMYPPAPEKAERWLAEATAGWQEKYPDVRLHRAVVRDRVVDGLVRMSLSCELLVVGGHSRHPHVAAVLGSVSQNVLRHAQCPVAVVH
jgi:nucleotide-binding universal stress UspA family protein